jgi:hypothetical protein
MGKKGDDLPDEQFCRLVDQLVLLPVDFEIDLSTDSIIQVDLAIDQVAPGRRVRVCHDLLGL